MKIHWCACLLHIVSKHVKPRTHGRERALTYLRIQTLFSLSLSAITHSHPSDPSPQTLNFSFRHSDTATFVSAYERGLQFWNSVDDVLPHEFQGQFFFFFFRFFLSNLKSSHWTFAFQIAGEKRGSTHAEHNTRKRVKIKDLDSLVNSAGKFAFQPNYVVLSFSKHAFLSPKDSAFHPNIGFNYCFFQ